VKPGYQRRGVATRLLTMASAEHCTVYFSTQAVGEDTRSMSLEAGALVRSTKRHGVDVIVTHPDNLEFS
jgi:hypothetical protein